MRSRHISISNNRRSRPTGLFLLGFSAQDRALGVGLDFDHGSVRLLDVQLVDRNAFLVFSLGPDNRPTGLGCRDGVQRSLGNRRQGDQNIYVLGLVRLGLFGTHRGSWIRRASNQPV